MKLIKVIVLGSLPWIASCTALDTSSFAPVIGSGGCNAAHVVAPGGDPSFPLLLPRNARVDLPPGTLEGTFKSYDEYVAQSRRALRDLPPEIKDHKVTNVLFLTVLNASSRAQLRANGNSSAPGGPSKFSNLESQIRSLDNEASLTYEDLKDFSSKLMDRQLHPSLSATGSPAASASEFSRYFQAYYGGTFVDRFGNKLAKPNVSFGFPVAVTVTDAQIQVAETVLLEYLIDGIDPTPIVGDATSESTISATTKFYPAATTDKPTALAVNRAEYRPLSDGKCEFSPEAFKVLLQTADAASDRAAALGGLTFNSAGGFGFSLGVFGKISLGDNQTLSAMAKTLVSRLASRATYAGGFWLISRPTSPGAAEGSSVTLNFAY